MGQFMSSNRNHRSNDRLINELIKTKYILTTEVEKTFRCVDRGFYFDDDDKNIAYRDTAWQSDLVHLSAPNVYATVLESLALHPGLKFLNIGSGTGYFSTIVGLILGINGVNHGIEINQLAIDRAYQKMEEFKLNSAAIDYYDFCEPVFIHGNVCDMNSIKYYDRVYCGASVPPEESEFLKSFINIGGILVMPLDGFLLKITRVGEHSWKSEELLEVAFTSLVVPETCSFDLVKFPSVEILSLQEICRSKIRSLLRENIIEKYPNLSIRSKCEFDVKGNSQNIKDNLPNTVNFIDRVGSLKSDLLESDSDDSSVEIYSDRDHDFDDDDNDDDGDDNDDDDDDDSDGNEITEENRLLNHSSVNIWSDGSTKRKSLEAEKNVSTDEENQKKMKMNISSQNTENNPSTLSHSASGSECSSLHSEIEFVSHSNHNISLEYEPSDRLMQDIQSSIVRGQSLGGLYRTMFDDSSEEESEEDSEVIRDSYTYIFISERAQNELSILLKRQINLLPIPEPVKKFLNYSRN